MSKIRLDQLLVDQGLAKSKTEAQRLIMAGKVSVPSVQQPKPGMLVDSETEIGLDSDEGYASRGAYKLIGALDYFELDPEGLVCVDLGASTGGFTDVLLRGGARKVYAVDVGEHLLDQRLASDPRVTVMDQTNARELPEFPEKIDLVVCDVSFISLTKLMPALQRLAEKNPKAQLLLMIKPQFELGREIVDKSSGIIKDRTLQLQAVETVKRSAVEHGFTALGQPFPASIKGPKGNQEYFLYLTTT